MFYGFAFKLACSEVVLNILFQELGNLETAGGISCWQDSQKVRKHSNPSSVEIYLTHSFSERTHFTIREEIIQINIDLHTVPQGRHRIG
jgi:hypothetical protein